MPVYEYKCVKCNYEFELHQKVTEMPAGTCPECSGKVKRLISKSSFIVHGSKGIKGNVKPRCGQESTCCGSSVPCEEPSCYH